MKEQVKEMFAEVTMPEETAQKIRHTMQQARKSRRHGVLVLGRTAAAITAMLALVLTVSPTARAAAKDLVRYVIADASFVRDDQTGDVLEIAIDEETDGHMFVETSDGKMYFSVDGQYIDITGKTSMEKPYIYTYIDDANVEHMLIIGGVPDNFGVSEFYRDVSEDAEPWNGWIGGYSENYFDNEAQKAYPWLAAAWEELNIPWPLPG